MNDLNNPKLTEEYLKENLIKLLNKSLEGLNQTINEINSLKKKDFDLTLSYYHINNLKINLNYIQKQYDSNLKLILEDIHEHIENFNEIKFFFNHLSKEISLEKIYSSIGLYNQIDSIHLLFTGFGVLGIVPLQTTRIINNTASEIMFMDKLERLNDKLHFIAEILQKNQDKQIEILSQYFKKNLSH